MSEMQPGTGYTYRQDARGITLDILPDTRPSLNYPFKVIHFKDGATHKVRVLPGTANNLVPKIGGNYLDATVPPTLTVSAGKTHICLKVTYSTATFFPEAAEIVALTSEGDMAATNTNGFLQLASVDIATVNGSEKVTVNQYIFSSQMVIRAKPGSGTAVWAFNSR
jgi:hypothetical protein